MKFNCVRKIVIFSIVGLVFIIIFLIIMLITYSINAFWPTGGFGLNRPINYNRCVKMISEYNLPLLNIQPIAERTEIIGFLKNLNIPEGTDCQAMTHNEKSQRGIYRFRGLEIDELTYKEFLNNGKNLTSFISKNQIIPSQFFNNVKMIQRYYENGILYEQYIFNLNEQKYLDIEVGYTAEDLISARWESIGERLKQSATIYDFIGNEVDDDTYEKFNKKPRELVKYIIEKGEIPYQNPKDVKFVSRHQKGSFTHEKYSIKLNETETLYVHIKIDRGKLYPFEIEKREGLVAKDDTIHQIIKRTEIDDSKFQEFQNNPLKLEDFFHKNNSLPSQLFAGDIIKSKVLSWGIWYDNLSFKFNETANINIRYVGENSKDAVCSIDEIGKSANNADRIYKYADYSPDKSSLKEIEDDPFKLFDFISKTQTIPSRFLEHVRKKDKTQHEGKFIEMYSGGLNGVNFKILVKYKPTHIYSIELGNTGKKAEKSDIIHEFHTSKYGSFMFKDDPERITKFIEEKKKIPDCFFQNDVMKKQIPHKDHLEEEYCFQFKNKWKIFVSIKFKDPKIVNCKVTNRHLKR